MWCLSPFVNIKITFGIFMLLWKTPLWKYWLHMQVRGLTIESMTYLIITISMGFISVSFTPQRKLEMILAVMWLLNNSLLSLGTTILLAKVVPTSHGIRAIKKMEQIKGTLDSRESQKTKDGTWLWVDTCAGLIGVWGVM